MPAYTPQLVAVPRLAAPKLTDRPRPVRSIHTAPAGFEGEGFPVRRAFAGIPLSELDPFVHMDHMGAIDWPPFEAKGTPWHPHRGFETVTYIIDGTFVHQDSHGGGGVISDGDTQWMTAGSGILHIETPPEELVVSGGLFHGVQLWVNLPARSKFVPPAYQSIAGSEVAVFSSPDGGVLGRLIAGEVDGFEGPGSTHSPIVLAHLTMQPESRIELPWPKGFNALVYVLDGDAYAGPGERPITAGQLAILGDGDTISLRAAPSRSERTVEVLLLGGEPIGEPVAMYGPFVMNTDDEIRQAIDDFEAGRLGRIPEDGIQPYRRNASA